MVSPLVVIQAFAPLLGTDKKRQGPPGASLDAYYSKVNSAITASSLSADQVAALPGLGYSVSNSLAASVSDNTTYSLMGEYKICLLYTSRCV